MSDKNSNTVNTIEENKNLIYNSTKTRKVIYYKVGRFFKRKKILCIIEE